MSQLWTDIVDPATLTGYARQSLENYEAQNGSLREFLPNRVVPDVVVRFNLGDNGLVEEAAYRAFDAEPEIGRGPGGRRVTVELPAIGRNEPISEYNQIRGRAAADPAIEGYILNAADRAVRAVADRTVRMRGHVLVHGKATIDQSNFISEDDFGRDEDLTIVAQTLWSDPASDPLNDLKLYRDLYTDKNGVEPGALIMSRQAMTALTNGDQFKVNLIGGGSRPATEADVEAILAANGLPPVHIYNRRTASGPVIPADRVLMLPAPVGDNQVTELGNTFWGQTLTAEDPNWAIADEERPGIVVGAYKNPKPPMIAEVISDAISLPVLANANLSLCAKVL